MSTAPTQLKKVLFVDDNLQFLEMIERLMGNWSKGEWQIFLAQNSGKALLILQEHSIDLAVVDVQMPVVDGIQFLALLNRKYPSVQKVTLSAYADDAVPRRLPGPGRGVVPGKTARPRRPRNHFHHPARTGPPQARHHRFPRRAAPGQPGGRHPDGMSQPQFLHPRSQRRQVGRARFSSRTAPSSTRRPAAGTARRR